jgi:hypothetical protein
MGDLRVYTLAVKAGQGQRKRAGVRSDEPTVDETPEPVVEETEAVTTLHQPAAASHQ